MELRRILLLAAAPILLIACGADQPPGEPGAAEGVDVFQMFRPELPYGKEGSAAGVVLVRNHRVKGAMEPVRSEPSLTPQSLGRVPVGEGRYRVVAFQKACNAECPATNPRLARARGFDISCTGKIDTGEDSGIFIYVNPKTRRCVVSPLQSTPLVECSTGDPLLKEVFDSYPAIDWDPPTEVCVVDLGGGRILDVSYNGSWGAMRRDVLGVVGKQ